jgi:CTP synthase
VAGLEGAHSSEFLPTSAHPVIGLITEWMAEGGQLETRDENSDLGGSMRLGGQQCQLQSGSLAFALYQKDVIMERHRHRYEFNNQYIERLEKAGMQFSGKSIDGRLVEVVEIPEHPWFLACQFHPEFTSTPRQGHPLFSGFVKAAAQYKKVISS